MEPKSQTRRCAALIVDIAGTVGLRSRLGDDAAGRRIRILLEAIIAASREHGGEFIKSYGDDVLAIFEKDPLPSAARVAIQAQRLARDAGLQLYAGFHAGDVEFRETMGHPDAIGLTVNIAARLHKLTEGAPGRIFLTEDSLEALPNELRARTNRFGVRDLKGIGQVSIWTLDWQSEDMVTVAVAPGSASISATARLTLSHGSRSVQLAAGQASAVVGRGKDCLLRVPDPEPRISSAHVMFELSAGRWFVQDISRNGTWLRDATTGQETILPSGRQSLLPQHGRLCLGRAFADDPAGHFVVSFTLAESG